ncbi:MAG TPA: NTP transferase domain-containing protein [Acidimicrobiales bacterium]
MSRVEVPPFSGAVLCGGASRRMGQDKALIVVDGRALAVRVAAALREAGASDVVAVGGDLAALRAAGLAAVPDAEPGEGPLAGIVTALGHADDDVVFVAGCDLVDPSPPAMAATVRALAASRGGDVAVAVVDGRRQWVHAAWRRHGRAPLAAAFAAGERAVHAAVAAAGLRVVDVPLDAGAVADADEPSDLPGPAGG